MRAIRPIVSEFKKMTDEERYHALSKHLEGHAETAAELTWRSKLCTALQVANVYPEAKPE